MRQTAAARTMLSVTYDRKSRSNLREPAGIALRATVGSRPGGDNGVNSLTEPRGDQRDQRGEGLPG